MTDSDSDTILLVDDNQRVRMTLRHALHEAGYRVEEAADGLEAFGRLQRGLRPCIIVLDLEMPIMAGDTFRRAQQARADLRDIPVVLFSSAPNLADIAQSLGVAAYAAKPMDAAQMLAIIDRHCDKSRRASIDSRAGGQNANAQT
jgi:CheY-like chemotaxis protein